MSSRISQHLKQV